MDTIGYRLKYLRAKDGRTQEEIALVLKQFGVKADRGTVARWENDLQLPKLSPVRAFAKIYDVTADFIIDGSTDDAKLTELCHKLKNACIKLNDEGQKALLEYSDFLCNQDKYKIAIENISRKKGIA